MRLTIEGHEVGYDVRGAGPAVLLLHAFPFDRRMWNDTLAALSSDYRVIAFDFPGFGESALPPPGLTPALTIDAMADGAVRVLDALGVPMATVAGLSMGGYVALAFAERHAARLSGLVLADTRAGADSPEGRVAREDGIKKVRADGTGEFLDGIPFRLLSGRADDALRRRVRGLAEQRAEGIVAALGAMRDRPDRTPILAAIRCPTLVLVGAEDTVTPPTEAQALARAIPGATLVELARGGHLSNLEAAEAFHASLTEFLASLRPA